MSADSAVPAPPADASEADLRAYYAKRATEYERIYDKPERQADLARLRADIPALLAGERVLEIACGTGYWTPLIAAQAHSVVALDVNEEVLRIARSKIYPRANVRFVRGDAYDPPRSDPPASAAYAGFWWSHLPLARIPAFVSALQHALRPGARVVVMDNAYVEGSSTPISRTDREGNSYQRRPLGDGAVHEVLKNFPDADGLRSRLPPDIGEFRWQAYPYYWLASWRMPA